MKQGSEIGRLLREAADILDDGHLDRAAWRVADAGGLLRAELDGLGGTLDPTLPGYVSPSGRGYLLPVGQYPPGYTIDQLAKQAEAGS